MESNQKKLLLKCFRGIEFEEISEPGVECRGRIALVFVCDDVEDCGLDDEPLGSRLVLCRWDVDRLSGETMWMEWDGDCDGWRGPVEDVVGWSWLEG
jgi:hypothetical protein